jgi:hypothetical protein
MASARSSAGVLSRCQGGFSPSQQIPPSRSRSASLSARVGARTAVLGLVRMLQVVRPGAQRLQHHRAVSRGQPDGDADRLVLVVSPGQLPVPGHLLLLTAADPPVCLGEPLQLVGGHRSGHRHQVTLGFRSGDPGQRADFGVGQPPGRELLPDQREVTQQPRHPDVLAGGARGDLALPRQPRRARGHLPRRPAAAGIKVREQQQELAGRGGQVPGQLADAGLQVLHRHRQRIVGVTRNQVRVPCRLPRNGKFGHTFDCRRRV